MKERIKWIAIGFGFMVGIQVLASLLFIGLAQMLEASPNLLLEPYGGFVILGLTLGSFFLGGFIIARVEEAPRIIDAVIAAIATLALSVLGVPRNPAIPYFNYNKPDRYGYTANPAGATYVDKGVGD